MKPYVHCVLLAGLLTAGCQRPASTASAETGSADRTRTNNAGTVEVPARTQFYVRFDKTLDSAKVKTGDLVIGELDQPIVAGGRDVLPRGTKLDVRVTNSQLASAPGSVGLLTLNIETIKHNGGDYQLQATPVTVQTSPVDKQVDPNAQVPHTPLTEKEGRANAVLRPGQALLFETTAPVSIKP
jgi:hypothetical protein